MEPQTLREIVLSNNLNKVRFQLIYDQVYLTIKKIQLTSHLGLPENEWRPCIEKLTLNLRLEGSDAHTIKIPINFVTLASSFTSSPDFDIDITVPDSISKINRYTGGKWESIEISIGSSKPINFEVKIFFESDMIQG